MTISMPPEAPRERPRRCALEGRTNSFADSRSVDGEAALAGLPGQFCDACAP